MKYGHNIGLHFDETVYEIAGEKSQYDLGNIVSKIKDEAFILGNVLNYPINSVSYHRPSKAVLDADLEIPGMINSYGHMFFSGFKYLSDSRRRWREPVLDIIKAQTYPRLHILTHAFWYYEKEKSLQETVSQFINSSNTRCWNTMKENITDLEAVMPIEKLL